MTDRVTLKQRASKLRSNQTPAEQALWMRLRMRQVCGVRFLRQRVIGSFIVDFYAPSLRLAVELDGGQHYEAAGLRYDQHRAAWLEAQDITILRYTTLDVMQRFDDVLADIEREVVRLQESQPPPLRGDPLRSEGGRRFPIADRVGSRLPIPFACEGRNEANARAARQLGSLWIVFPSFRN